MSIKLFASFCLKKTGCSRFHHASRFVLVTLLLCPFTAQAAPGVLSPINNLRLSGDVIVGYFYDNALLPNTSGRERQAQLMRGVIGISGDIGERWSFLGEYNIANTEIYRDDDNSARFDWYRNLGVDLTYYGNSNAREVYFNYGLPWDPLGVDLSLRVGRQYTPVGFDPGTLPYWSRIDAPHTVFLSNGLLTGINLRGQRGGLQTDLFYFMGQDHPGRSYNDHALENDPQVKGNSFGGVALRLQYAHTIHGVDARYHLSGHFDKLGSATGTLQQGKHNDYRTGAGAELSIPLPPWLGFESLDLGAEFMRFRTGLTEDGGQGKANLPGTLDIHRDGIHGTAALNYRRWSIRYTHERLDRGDTNILARVAKLDTDHPAMDALERSHILALSYSFTDQLDWRFVYRWLDNPFPEASHITEHLGRHHGEDKYMSDLRWRF